jgi:hypothetical protein
MNDDYIKIELKELKDNGLIEGYKIIKDDLNEYRFVLITLEGGELDITKSYNNTYLLDGKCYECFEQILTKYSEKYVKEFSNIMMRKLANLDRDSDD